MISIDEINKLQAQNKGLIEQNRQLQQDISILQGKLNAFQMSENEANEIIEELKAENERLKEENVKLLFGKGTLVEFCNKLTQIIDEKKENENKLLQTLQEIKNLAEKTGCRAFIEIITKAEEE